MKTRLVNENYKSHYVDELLVSRGLNPEELESFYSPTIELLQIPVNLTNITGGIMMFNDIVSLISGNENLKINNIKNNQLNKTFKNNNQTKYKFEILNKYDNETLNQKIKENLEKMYKYYTDIYPGDKNKLRCKLYYIIILIFKIVSNMFTYHCHSEKQLKLFSSHNIKNTFIV